MNKVEAILKQSTGQPTAITAVQVPDKGALKKITFALKNNYPTMRLVLAAQVGQEVAVAIFVGDGTQEKGASTLLPILAPHIAAKGGGSSTFVFASGTNPSGIPSMLHEAKRWLQ